MAKRYYWLKLKDDFFTSKAMKKLRSIAGGDTYTIIYLKMQLLSIKDEGKLYFEGVDDSFAKELALVLDEDVENIKITIQFLMKNGLLKETTRDEYLLPEAKECIGSECSSAERVRKYRALKSSEKEQKMLLGNTLVTKCNTEKDKEIEKEIEIDIDKELDINNMSIIYNWDKNEKCDCLTRKNEKCTRRSTYKINGKNYCNQHSKEIIKTQQKTTKENYFENQEVNDLFIEFLKIRKKIKAVNSDLAIKKLINKLNKYEDNIKIKMLENSIVNSWKDVYELKEKKETSYEKLQREIREAEEEERKQKKND